MIDLDLLNTLLCVVEERNFTRTAERIHKTQSTVSQQISRLERSLGHTLLVRDRSGNNVVVTEQGEILATYARRLIELAQEAKNALAANRDLIQIRIGIPEDFRVDRITQVLSGFACINPSIRLEIASGMSIDLHAKLAADQLQLALVKREPGTGACVASWPESVVWVTNRQTVTPYDVLPLAVFPRGCIYRARAVYALKKAGIRWRVGFESPSLTGIQAAVSAGLAVGVLPRSAVLPSHRILSSSDKLPDLPGTELALIAKVNPVSFEQRPLVIFLCSEIEKILDDQEN
ncbi:LysR family transcriptional regulator [Burkholderia cepacia]|uniref:LysR family transcriptional regulator n=1 Tax=Burkholderia cepacia TaxID=292 RepID=A0AAX2R9K5_BURCE|nr:MULTISPECIES: LysR family transcriptional regulator [Burkholderia]MCA8429339.1 LysR family transcriptional regulator [Burkholderia seminalis]MCR5897268.1 LysR family transcriptional regulator [Burkholderia sp. HAN2018]RQR89752.1 LysR family transcriptional regulator [Burkholderia sp. Bp8994]RQR94642.1 LysR family transcriptional regulator [Burkholderia sp. Bp8991]RQS18769.1 LysR family transcriptional regulator [Burkholderia sp. Bp8995]